MTKKVVKTIKYHPGKGEKIERNDNIAYDRLVNGMSRLEASTKYNLTNSRIDQITGNYKVKEVK